MSLSMVCIKRLLLILSIIFTTATVSRSDEIPKLDDGDNFGQPISTKGEDQPLPDVEDEDMDIPDVEDECIPSMADRCFMDVSENLKCHLITPIGRNCTQRNAADLCEGLDDALNCTSDIVDTGCSASEGRQVFDTWLRGLRAVEIHLCRTGNMDIITGLLRNSGCWNLKKFIRCVETEANVTHVSDLLTTELDRYECNILQSSVSVCNAQSVKKAGRCRGKADVLHKALAVFFAATSCGEVAPICTIQRTSSAGSAVVATLVVVTIVVILLFMILVKHKILTVNPQRLKFNRQVSSSIDDDNYGRLRE